MRVLVVLALWSGVGLAELCVDHNNMCTFWMTQARRLDAGECEKNPTYMRTNCALACKACGVEIGPDGEPVMSLDDLDEEFYVDEGTELKNPLAMMVEDEENGGTSVKVLNSLSSAIEVFWVDQRTGATMKIVELRAGDEGKLSTFYDHGFSVRLVGGEEVSRFRIFPNRPRIVIDDRAVELFASEACADKSESCPQRAVAGECVSSPGWMSMMCSRSCSACYLRDPAVRCPRRNLFMAQTPALRPGALDPHFAALPQKWGDRYTITVHAGPAGITAPNADGAYPPDGPWIVTLDNFVNPDEAQAIVASVNAQFSRSTDQGAVDEYGEQEKIVSQGRTSENAWCTGACESNPSTVAVMERIEEVTKVPIDNYESFQVLRYKPGQYYRAHHDMSFSDNKLACGPRIYTFFLYLSDVEEGGETEFPMVRGHDGNPVKIKPKLGSALVWPSVLNDDPTKQDVRTKHAALPVKEGTKFAANAWIHLFDYNEPNVWGCTGSFD